VSEDILPGSYNKKKEGVIVTKFKIYSVLPSHTIIVLWNIT